ncbi:MAG: hypothetical protein WC313_00625 [Candidatus Kapaibacterium sp.]
MKIGLMYGSEKSLPAQIIKSINNSSRRITADTITLNAVKPTDYSDYAVIYDRISHKIPFYRNYLKQSLINGVSVINNPFVCHDESSFIYNRAVLQSGINVPKMVLLPSKEHPDNTSSESFKNLSYPLNWQEIFDFVGFPALLKTNISYNYIQAYKVYNPAEFFSAYDLMGKTSVLLIENIDFEEYYKVFVIIGDEPKFELLDYNPLKPLHLRFGKSKYEPDVKTIETIKTQSVKVSKLLDLHINSLEFGVKKDKIYLTSYHDPAPKMEQGYVDEKIWKRLVNNIADFLISVSSKSIEYKVRIPF